MTDQYDHLLDASGLLCPEPIMLLHNTMRDAAPDQIIKMLATDPSTHRDLTRFCEFLGHELLSVEETNDTFTFWLRKGKED
jgi:tRNA 2-thiouridine synthesizing protein A